MEGPIPVTRHLTQPVGRRAAVAQDARCLAMFPGFGVLTWAGRLASAISSPSRLPGADFQCLRVEFGACHPSNIGRGGNGGAGSEAPASIEGFKRSVTLRAPV